MIRRLSPRGLAASLTALALWCVACDAGHLSASIGFVGGLALGTIFPIWHTRRLS